MCRYHYWICGVYSVANMLTERTVLIYMVLLCPTASHGRSGPIPSFCSMLTSTTRMCELARCHHDELQNEGINAESREERLEQIAQELNQIPENQKLKKERKKRKTKL